MILALNYTVCPLRVLNGMIGKLLRSAHDSAAGPTVMTCLLWLLL